MEYEIYDIKKDKIEIIRSLWEKLNEIHLNDSIDFKEHYKTFTFEKRLKSLINHSDDNMKISIVNVDNNITGYCISVLENSNGEIESLCLSDEIQGHGIGKILVNNHISWMKEKKCEKIRVNVSCGHESVLGFYNKLGFKERLIVMEYKE
jgi:ribosomal protein S18 acetylase RimI-like enzyme